MSFLLRHHQNKESPQIRRSMSLSFDRKECDEATPVHWIIPMPGLAFFTGEKHMTYIVSVAEPHVVHVGTLPPLQIAASSN